MDPERLIEVAMEEFHRVRDKYRGNGARGEHYAVLDAVCRAVAAEFNRQPFMKVLEAAEAAVRDGKTA